MPSREGTVLIVTDAPEWWSACEEAGAYLGLDDRGRRIYRVPADLIDMGDDDPVTR